MPGHLIIVKWTIVNAIHSFIARLLARSSSLQDPAKQFITVTPFSPILFSLSLFKHTNCIV